jgi:60 kDa SS-A/Ro ribonucleoprotein
MIPDRFINEPKVWEALLDAGIPQTALMRQLPRLTNIGLLKPLTSTASKVAAQLADPERLKRARVHPMSVLIALRTYASGVSARGEGTWTPSRPIIDALDRAFYASYGAVEPTGKRMLIALDASGSMTHPVAGAPLTCREAAAATALVTANTEPMYELVAFTADEHLRRNLTYDGSGNAYGHVTGRELNEHAVLTPLAISPRQRLDDVVKTVRELPWAGTNCALPMVHALREGLEVDVFLIFTDNETWHGDIHPHQALNEYRRKTGIDARLVVVSMAANGASIADPTDSGMLDISGFDGSVPGLISDFCRGL